MAVASGNSGIMFVCDCWSVATGTSDEVLSLFPPSTTLLSSLLFSVVAGAAGVDDESAGGLSPSTDAVDDGTLSSVAAGGLLSIM